MLRFVSLRPLAPGALAAALFACGGPAIAAPLAFGDIAPDMRRADLARLATCPGRVGAAAQTCTLRRRSFGGLDIRSSALSLDEAGRPVALEIALTAEDARIAAELLEGRYGPARRSGETLAWQSFDDDALLTLAPRGMRTIVTFRFATPGITAIGAAPAASAASAGRDARPALSLLAVSLLALVAGIFLLWRNRRRRAAVPAEPEPSMRATLEKRLRDGRGLEF
jgi:hypothetical protein